MSLRHLAFLILLPVPAAVYAQDKGPAAPAPPAAKPQRPPTPNDTLVSTEIAGDHAVTFRLYAPKAETVKLASEFKGGGNVEMA